MIAANQRSVYGAVADPCNEIEGVRASGKPAAHDHVEKMEIPTDLSIAENSTNAQQRRNPMQEYEPKFEQLSEDQTLSKLCPDAFEACRKSNTSILLKQKKDNRCNTYAESTSCLAMKRRPV